MKKTQLLASIICISLVFCFFQKTQQAEISPFGQEQSLSIKFQKPLRNGRFSFPLGFTSENKTIPVVVTMDTNGLWINNNSYSTLSGSPFECLESKGCHIEEESLEQGWNALLDGATASVAKISDTVSFGGLVHSDFELFIVNQVEAKRFKDSSSNRLGLNFRDSSLNIPEQLKAKGIIQKSAYSISLKNNNEGELTLGGYPSQKAASNFQFTSLAGEQFGRPTIGFKALDFSSSLPNNQNSVPALLDWESPFLSLPKEYVDLINKEIDSKGLRLKHPLPPGIPSNGPDWEESISCQALTALEDLAIQLEGFVLYIPPAAYIRYGRGFNDEEEASENGCFLSVNNDVETSPYIILGQPLFKAYDIVFDSENKAIGFSGKHSSNISNKKLSKSFLLACVVLGIAGIGGLSYLFVKKSPKSYRPFDEQYDDEDFGESQSPNIELSESQPQSPNEEEKA